MESKHHYHVHHVWCLDQENMKNFFERVWDYQAKKQNFVICCIASCSMTRNLAGKQCSSSLLCCQKGIRFPWAESLPLCKKPCNFHLVLYEINPNPSPPCKRQRSSDSSTSDFASPTPEPENMPVEVEYPASPPWNPKTRLFGKISPNPPRLAFSAQNFILSKANFSNSCWSQSRGPIKIGG